MRITLVLNVRGPEPLASFLPRHHCFYLDCFYLDTITAARTIRKHRDGITAALDRGLSNGRQEGLNNNKVRLIIRRQWLEGTTMPDCMAARVRAAASSRWSVVSNASARSMLAAATRLGQRTEFPL